MYNKKFKQLLAVLLAVMMVLSLSVTALATEPAPVTGTGTPEGHVNKTVTNMVLPTTSSTTFAYKVDPEALIQETGGEKYADTTFPDAADDTHVYFLTGTNTYANTTNTLYAVNTGNQAVTLTVKVKAVANETDPSKDIALVAEDALESAATASLYLGFTVNGDTKALSTTEETFTKTIPGSDNYEVIVNSSNQYEYTKKAAPDGADGLSWKAAAISLTGVVNNKSIASDTTAPTVSVTWSWAPATADAIADENAVTVIEKSEGGSVTYEAGEVGPSVSQDTVTSSSRSFTITNGTLSQIVMTRTNTQVVNWTLNNQYTVSGDTVTVNDGPFTNTDNNNATLTLSFVDTTDTVTLTLIVA